MISKSCSKGRGPGIEIPEARLARKTSSLTSRLPVACRELEDRLVRYNYFTTLTGT
jgi:hypothetical protein